MKDVLPSQKSREKHIPLRLCVSCRERKEKKELIKIVRTSDGFAVSGSEEAGRGAYVCRNVDCVAKAAKKRLFDKSFRQKLPDEIYEELVGIANND